MATLQELLAQKAALEQQIEKTKSQARGDAIAKVRAMMDEYGLTAADLGGRKTSRAAPKPKKTKTGAKVAAKYRNASTGDTWSGRGLQPRWLKAALAGGKKLGDFAV